MQPFEVVLEESQQQYEMENPIFQCYRLFQIFSVGVYRKTCAELSTLNAFQNKSLWRIWHIPSTFIDREQTNASMYDNIRDDYGCSVHTLETHGARHSSDFLGFVLRASPANPLVQVASKQTNRHCELPPRTGHAGPKQLGKLKLLKVHIIHCIEMLTSLMSKQSARKLEGPFAV